MEKTLLTPIPTFLQRGGNKKPHEFGGLIIRLMQLITTDYKVYHLVIQNNLQISSHLIYF